MRTTDNRKRAKVDTFTEKLAKFKMTIEAMEREIARQRAGQISGRTHGDHGFVADMRDPRLPRTGTSVVRRFGGTNHRVTILADGFRYQGVLYGSLSSIATEITGHATNGFLFFGLA